jgi:hypothetical protein
MRRRTRALEVRVIGPFDEQLGVLPIDQALRLAQDAGLDLVEVCPPAKPPVCKIMDYGRLRYTERKRETAMSTIWLPGQRLSQRAGLGAQGIQAPSRPSEDRHANPLDGEGQCRGPEQVRSHGFLREADACSGPANPHDRSSGSMWRQANT